MTSLPIRSLAGKWLATAFLLLAGSIAALWYSAISAYEAAVLRERGRELQAIAELKIDFIRLWLDERRGDAAVQAGRLMMANTLAPRAGSYRPEEVKGQLEAVRRAYNYKAVTLLDRAGSVRLGAGPLSDFGRGATAAAARAAMAGGQVHVARAYPPDDAGRRHIDIAAPVADSRQPGAPIVGALSFHLDSRMHLDPLLRGWPAPSGSGESFLSERAGEDLIYLTSLRHADAELLRKRTDESSLPAAMAAKGGHGVVEGLDYRGTPVLAAVGQVPGMPWFVVAKLDRAEVLAPVRREMLWSGTLSSLLALALGLAMRAGWRRSQSELAYARQAAARQALVESEARYRALFQLSPDAIFVHCGDVIVFANEAAARLFDAGSPQALIGRNWHDLVAPEHWSVTEERVASLTGGQSSSLQPLERHYLTLGGRVFPAESSAARIAFDGAPAVLSITRDITERRKAEAQRLAYAREQRDTLVREVHHRIKNHLQGLAGLLNQHRRRHPGQHEALDGVIAQITAISVIHGLQGREASGEVRLYRLLQEIVAFLGGQAALDFRNADHPACRDCPWRIADEESVPVALAINELVTNAIKHLDKPGDGPAAPVRIGCACNDDGIAVTIHNPGTLPRGFDFAAGSGLGTGLALLRSLLSHAGAALSIAADGGRVEARLTLAPPVVSSKAAAV